MPARFNLYERPDGTLRLGALIEDGLLRMAAIKYLERRGYDNAAAYLVEDDASGAVLSGEDFLEDNPIQTVVAAWQGRPADGDDHRREVHLTWPNLGMAMDNLDNWLPMNGELPDA
jgi:hypothetical protein